MLSNCSLSRVSRQFSTVISSLYRSGVSCADVRVLSCCRSPASEDHAATFEKPLLYQPIRRHIGRATTLAFSYFLQVSVKLLPSRATVPFAVASSLPSNIPLAAAKSAVFSSSLSRSRLLPSLLSLLSLLFTAFCCLFTMYRCVCAADVDAPGADAVGVESSPPVRLSLSSAC